MADYGRGGGRGGRGGRGREVGGRGGGRGGTPSRHTLMHVLPPLHSMLAPGPWLSCFSSLLFMCQAFLQQQQALEVS